MARQTLDQWIQEILADSESKGGPCTAIALMHISAGQREQEIYTQKLGTTPWNPQELADMFRNRAQNHCAEIPGMQTFNLLAFYVNRNECQARRPFTEQGGAAALDGGQLMTEPPTGQGIIQQVMRHGEAYANIALRHTVAMVEQSANMVARVASMNERLMGEQSEMFGLLKDLLIQRDARVSETRMKELQFERSSRERSMLMKIAPSLLNGVTGRELIPQNAADTALIEGIAENMTEEDMSRIEGAVRPELWAPLAQRIMQVLKEKNHDATVRREAGNGADPEVDFQ